MPIITKALTTNGVDSSRLPPTTSPTSTTSPMMSNQHTTDGLSHRKPVAGQASRIAKLPTELRLGIFGGCDLPSLCAYERTGKQAHSDVAHLIDIARAVSLSEKVSSEKDIESLKAAIGKLPASGMRKALFSFGLNMGAYSDDVRPAALAAYQAMLNPLPKSGRGRLSDIPKKNDYRRLATVWISATPEERLGYVRTMKSGERHADQTVDQLHASLAERLALFSVAP